MRDGITKRQSSVIQGIAVLLMIFHHSTICGEEIYFLNAELAMRFAWFGKMCVALFAFVSGYGMFYVLRRETEMRFFQRLFKDYKAVARRLFSVYQKYWLVFFVFLGPALLRGALRFEAGEFFRNLFAVSSTYQETWWYMGQYVKMMLLLPPLELLFLKLPDAGERRKKWICAGILSGLVIVLLLFGALFYPPVWKLLTALVENLRISFFLPFCEGYLLARFKGYQWICHKTERMGKLWTALTAALLLILAVALRIVLADSAAYARADFLIVPIFVYAVLILLQYVPPVETVLEWIGRRSAYMWLIHGFFYAYLLQWLIGRVHSGELIYVIITVLSALAAWIPDLVRKLLTSKKARGYNDEKRKMQ